jgi:chromosome segregation and condensation protein ScpB
MPTVVTFLAVRAGLRDAREGQPPFLWAILTDRARRRQLVIRAVKGIGKILVMATVLDTLYQLIFLRAMHLFQLVIVVLACAIVPYVAIRGPVTRIAVFVRRKRTMAADELEPSR